MGENETFVGGEGILKAHGVEVVNLGKRETSVGSGVETRWATARPGGGGGGGGGAHAHRNSELRRSRLVQNFDENLHQGAPGDLE